MTGAADLAQIEQACAAVASSIEAAAAAALAELGAAFPAGGVVAAELAIGGAAMLKVTGTRASSGVAPYSIAQVRCALAAEPGGLGSELERIRLEQAASGAAVLSGEWLAGGAGGVFAVIQLWGDGTPGTGGSVLAFPDPQALEAFNAAGVPGFAIAGVGVVNDTYQLIRAPAAAVLAAADGVNVIAATAPIGAVWLRQYDRNLAAQYQTDWALDAANGDDRNAGTTAEPLRTMRELSQRLRGATIGQNVTITLAAGDYSAEPVEFDLTILQGASVLMVGAVSERIDTLANVLDTVPGAPLTNAGAQRGAFDSTALAIQGADNLARVRIIGGPNDQAMAWVTRVVSTGLGGTVNTTKWGRLPNVRTSTAASPITPMDGETYSIDSLDSVVGNLGIRVLGRGRFAIQDVAVRVSGATVAHQCAGANGNGSGVLAYGCSMDSVDSALFESGGRWTLALCRVASDAGSVVLNGVGLTARLSLFAGPVQQVITVQNNALLRIADGACFARCGVQLNTGGALNQLGVSNNDIQFVDRSGPSSSFVTVTPTGRWQTTSGIVTTIWGLDNTPTAAGFVVQGRFVFTSTPSVPGATNDVNVGGVTGSYAALPLIVTTAAAGTAASAGAGGAMVT